MGDIVRYHLQKYYPPNCSSQVTIGHVQVLWSGKCVTLYQKQYRELVLGSAAVCFNKLYGFECDCDVILHSGQVQEEAFYVCDIGDIVHKHREWKLKMPRVEPFYGKAGS